MINVLICEDQKILLDGIASTISKSEDINVIAKITDAAKISECLKTCNANLVLTDVCTENGNNSLDYIAEIKRQYPQIKIVVMTGLPEISFADRAKEAGADSFVYKNISSEELIGIIKSSAGGYNIFPTDNKSEIISQLSKQEINVLRFFCEGLDRKEIAAKMFISESSVKTHITNMLSKTGFNSISRLALHVVSSGLILPD